MPDETSAVGMERKLAAIFSTDVAGYSRLMGDDEEATIRTLTAYRAVISLLIQQYRGRVIDSPGDNLLAEFASVVDAVRCAVEIQNELKVKNAELPEHRQMRFRIGINLGDVIVEGERLYGDGVNIAARLESLALPGGICISRPVYDQVETKLALTYEDLGEQTVKNIAKPVRVYRVVTEGETESQKSKGKSQRAKVEDRRVGIAHHKWPLIAATGLLLVAATFVTARYLSFSSFRTPQSPIRIQEAQLPLPDKPSIVVLPFDNMSKDPEQEYFSDGITEVLTGDLSRISSLFVIARNTAFTYKGKAVNMQNLGKELGVRYALEGSVQKANEQVRIVTQLIDTTTGSHLWAEQYDRLYKDIFAIQDEIVRKIVTTLKLQLTLQEQGRIVRKRTDNLEAYDTFLHGTAYVWRLTKDANLQARQLFEKALALDPQYAEAYAQLGYTYYNESLFRWSTDPQALERGVELAQKAVSLNDASPVAHSALSGVYALKQQYDQAIAEGALAIDLDPNHADSYCWQAEVLNFAGRSSDALRMMEQAMRLNPRYPATYLFELGWTYRMTDRYAEAITALEEGLSQNPNFVAAHHHLAFSYLLQWTSQQGPPGQTLEPARAAAQRALALNDALPWSHIALGYISLLQRQHDQALAQVKRAVALAPNDAVTNGVLALVLSCAGRTTEALQAAAQVQQMKSLIVDEHLGLVGTAYYVAGKPEEAIAPLQQYLSRHPNHLDTHLTLAAVYSELGKDAEAKAAAAEVLRINPNFSLAVHKERTPIKDPATLERSIAVLRKAGLK